MGTKNVRYKTGKKQEGVPAINLDMRMTNRTSTTLRPASGRAGGGRIKGQAVNVLLARFGCGGQERRRLRRLGETADILLARFENIGTQVLEASVNSGLRGILRHNSRRTDAND